MVAVAQLVRVPGCGPGGRRFEPGQPPHEKGLSKESPFSAIFVGRVFSYPLVTFAFS